MYDKVKVLNNHWEVVVSLMDDEKRAGTYYE